MRTKTSFRPRRSNVAEKFNSSFFLRSIALSYANRLVLLVLGLAYIILVANALGPETFGVYSYLLDLAGTVLFLLGMESFSEVLRVFIPKTSSRRLVKTIVLAQFAIALALAAGILLFSEPLSQLLERGSGIPFGLLGLTVLLLPISSISYAIAAGNRQFGKLMLLSVVESLSDLVLAGVFVFGLGMGINGVFIARIVSLVLMGIAGIVWLNSGLTDAPVSRPAVFSYAKQSWLTTVFKKIGLQANLIYTGLFVSASALGFFYLLSKISTYIIDIPVSAINEALLPFASQSGDNKSFTENLISKNVKLSMIFSVATSALLLLCAPFLVVWFFPAFSNALVLVPLFVGYYILSYDYPLASFFRAINRPDVLTITHLVSAVNSITVGYFLISQFFVEGLLVTMIIGRLQSQLIFVYYIRKNGYKIEFVPRKKDFFYFAALARRFFKEGMAGVSTKKNFEK